MKNVYICLHNPCELRSLDATRICNYLSKNNYYIVSKPENADIIIFVSCAVVNKIAEESLRRIKEFQKYEPYEMDPSAKSLFGINRSTTRLRSTRGRGQNSLPDLLP